MKFSFELQKESQKAGLCSVKAGYSSNELLYLTAGSDHRCYSGISLACAFSLVRSGVIDPTITAGTYRNAGVNGNWWSSRGDAATNAYNLNFNATGVYPSNGPNARYVGRSLRCLSLPRGADLLHKIMIAKARLTTIPFLVQFE